MNVLYTVLLTPEQVEPLRKHVPEDAFEMSRRCDPADLVNPAKRHQFAIELAFGFGRALELEKEKAQ